MRLVAEIIIIAALISLGWNKPFKDQFAQANTIITTQTQRPRLEAAKTPGPLCAAALGQQFDLGKLRNLAATAQSLQR